MTKQNNDDDKKIAILQDDIIKLIREWEKQGWICSVQHTIDQIKENNCITIRDDNTGYDIELSIILPITIIGIGEDHDNN